jgi:hypothetical protein
VKRALSSCLVALGVVVGCGSSSDYGDAPDGASRQSSIDLEIGPAPPEVLLIVADDRADAEELRQLVQLEIESFATRSLGIAPACAAEEPTRKHPIDVSLVLVHPSAMGDARFAGPSTLPALRWQEADATQSGRLAWVSAVRAALDETHSEGPFAALAAMKSAIELVDGKRTPDGAGESSLLGSLPSAARVTALFLAAHEDESAGEPSSYAVSLPDGTRFDAVLLPSASPVDPLPTCGTSSEPASDRLEAWREARQGVLPMLWPCNGLRLLQPVAAMCPPRCVAWRPLSEDDGRASCRMLVDAEVDHCDAASGWLDPVGEDGVRRPLIPTPSNPAVRTCEIRQLSGSALASCQSTLSCADCEPGWCATDVPDLLAECARGAPLPVRFVGSADIVAAGVATLLCNVQRVDD